MDIFGYVIRELAASIGITLCSKCLAWTKIIKTDHIKDHIWEGYAICPKCGQKDKWIDGGDGV
jgi:Zn finger protein HypA/HybF involved in hydrogenase expression